MLFVALMKVRAGTEEERTTRRMHWEYPDGVKVVAECWLQTPDPNVVLIFEADSVALMFLSTAAWNDVFDIRIYPAIAAEEGLEMAKQMME